jgi:hypothetical protein
VSTINLATHQRVEKANSVCVVGPALSRSAGMQACHIVTSQARCSACLWRLMKQTGTNRLDAADLPGSSQPPGIAVAVRLHGLFVCHPFCCPRPSSEQTDAKAFVLSLLSGGWWISATPVESDNGCPMRCAVRSAIYHLPRHAHPSGHKPDLDCGLV